MGLDGVHSYWWYVNSLLDLVLGSSAIRSKQNNFVYVYRTVRSFIVDMDCPKFISGLVGSVWWDYLNSWSNAYSEVKRKCYGFR